MIYWKMKAILISKLVQLDFLILETVVYPMDTMVTRALGVWMIVMKMMMMVGMGGLWLLLLPFIVANHSKRLIFNSHLYFVYILTFKFLKSKCNNIL